jgi:hypothetical protein
MKRWLMLTIVGLAACSSIQTKTDFDPSVNFARYGTFLMLQGEVLPSETGAPPNTMVQERIRDRIRSELQAKGLTPDNSRPDLLVGYVAGARTKQELMAAPPYDPMMGPYMGPAYWNGTVQTWTYQRGTLVIDLIDSNTKKMVWRTIVEADKNQLADLGDPQLIREAVAKAFKNFPPKS